MIKEIAKFIASKTSFVIGTTLQVGHRTQDAPARCNVVLESAGGALNFDLPDFVGKMIQVISRAKTYFDARDDAWEIFNVLHGTAGWTLSAVSPATQNYGAMVIEALADPQYIGQDDTRRFEFSCNYQFKIKKL